MTHEDKGHYAKKHAPDRQMNREVADAIKQRITSGEISCAAAHKIAGELNTSPDEVGVTLDFLEMRIVKCQLGLFGYRPEKKVVKPSETISPDLETAINQSLSNGKLPCRAAWEMAGRFNMARMEISSACEALKIKVSPCQLGAF